MIIAVPPRGTGRYDNSRHTLGNSFCFQTARSLYTL